MVGVVVTDSKGGVMRSAFVLGVLALVLSAGTSLLALTPLQAPEIDGSSLGTGLAILAAGALILRSRMSK